MARRLLRLQAALHETRCAECRVTWRSWWRRLRGDPRGMTPFETACTCRHPDGRGGRVKADLDLHAVKDTDVAFWWRIGDTFEITTERPDDEDSWHYVSARPPSGEGDHG